jgi:hypothetical protein
MKFTFLRALAALALGLALSACGGKATYDVSGTISGLTNDGMILTNNGGDDISIPAGATSFTFPHRASYGDNYDIEFKLLADGVNRAYPNHMTCVIGYNTGSAGHTVNINAQIVCQQATHNLGGTVIGMAGCPAVTDAAPYCLTLVNGSTGGQLSIAKPADGSNNTAFTFSSQVKDGDSYGVTVLTQPPNMTCTVTNGSGVMHTGDVGNVIVTCVPN